MDYDLQTKDYTDHVLEFYRTLETCNTDQRPICNEVLETLVTINEVFVTTFSDKRDEQQLLFEDILELSRHFQNHLELSTELSAEHYRTKGIQSGVEEHVKSYQESLQKTNKEQFYSLQRRISFLQHSSKDAKERALLWNIEHEGIKDRLMEFLSLTTRIIHCTKELQEKSSRFLGKGFLKQILKKMKEHRQKLNVDIYKQHVTDYYRTLERLELECNTEQQSFPHEIIEAFKAIHEETLLSFQISVGSNDAVNVQQLLFEDVFELSRHLQPGVEEHVASYQQRLQEANEDQLYHLLRRVSLLPPNSMNPEELALGWEMKEKEMKDLAEYLSLNTIIIRSLIACRTQGNSCYKKLHEKMKEHREMLTYEEELRTVNEINKRNLGMMIIHHVGHEGREDKHGLRRLLQACIDFLQTKTAMVWRNASITIYDEDDNMYKIGSGEMKHQFICQMNNGEPLIIDRMSVSSGSVYRPYAETVDHPSKQGYMYMDKCEVS